MQYDDRVIALINEAMQWVGIREDGGPNRGPAVDSFERAVSPKVVGLPWCLSFIQYCVQVVDRNAGDDHKSPLPVTAGCLDLWHRAPLELVMPVPKPGLIVLWQRWTNGHPTGSGHAGLITHLVDAHTVATIEGNTGPGPGIVSEGDGVYARVRTVYGPDGAPPPGATMHLLGYLRAWPVEKP